MVTHLDASIGNTIKVLDELNMLDETVIVFSSDNGGMPFGGGFNYPFRGSKGTYYDGGVRVPAFVYGPKYFPKSFQHNHLFHIADFVPTLLSLVDKKASIKILENEGLDGIDQLPTLQKPEAEAVRDRVHITRSDSVVYILARFHEFYFLEIIET